MSVNLAENPTASPTVFVIDDDDGVRNAIVMLIESMSIKVLSFNSVRSFLDEYETNTPGCLVLDVRLPQISGLELQEHFQRHDIHIPIIFLSGHSNIAMAVRTMKAGAIDFLEKPFDDQMLLDSIQKAIEIDHQTRNKRKQHSMVMEKIEALSPREEDVLRLLIQGKANKVIAHEMDLSTKTIETHRAHIMHKLGVSSMAGLMWMAITSGEFQEIPEQLPFTLPDTDQQLFSLH